MAKKQELSNFAKNVRALRMLFGETQEELAFAVGESGKTTVSSWETGTNVPERKTVVAIAKHYSVTTENLLHGEIYKASFKPDQLKVDDMQEAGIELLEIFCSDRAMNNKQFEIAYNADIIIKEAWSPNSTVELTIDLWETCIDGYSKAYDEGIKEAGLNLLRQMVYIELSQLLDNGHNENNDKEIDMKSILKSYLAYGEENLSGPQNDFEEKLKSMEEMEKASLLLIKDLRSSVEYRDYLDYYIALKYTLGLSNNGRSRATNIEIGWEMMTMLAMLHNTYALKYTSRMISITKGQ